METLQPTGSVVVQKNGKTIGPHKYSYALPITATRSQERAKMSVDDIETLDAESMPNVKAKAKEARKHLRLLKYRENSSSMVEIEARRSIDSQRNFTPFESQTS